MPNQVVVSDTFRKGMSATTKICAQMCVKMGGALWSVTTTEFSGTMIVGYDIYKEKRDIRPTAAMVSVLDDAMTKYTSSSNIQDSAEAVSDSFNLYFTSKIYVDLVGNVFVFECGNKRSGKIGFR